MRIAFVLFAAFLTAATLVPVADAQRRPMRQAQQPTQPGPNTDLAAIEIPDQERMRCVLQSLHMTRGGMALRCSYPNYQTGVVEQRLVAFDGGTQPGGISAAMRLAIHLDQRYPGEETFTVRFRAPSQAARNICNMVRTEGSSAYECVEGIAFGG